MKKISLVFLIIIGAIFFLVFGDYFLKEPKTPVGSLENLSLIILNNTKFQEFSVNGFSFQYPADWKKVEVDPFLIWPEEIAKKEKILLYLTNLDGVKILVSKRELTAEELRKPYPLIFREILAQETKILREEGGLIDYQIIREEFFENGIFLESRKVLFGQRITSFSKSIILRKEENKAFLYSVGISSREQIFEDYRLLGKYIIDSVSYY